MASMFPESAVRGEIVTEIFFLRAFTRSNDLDASRRQFFIDLDPRSEIVPAFGLSSDTWEDFLEECVEVGFLSRNGVVTLTPRGQAHLNALLEEADGQGIDLAS